MPTAADPPAASARWRRVLFWLLVVELTGVLLFLGLLVLGERSRLTLIALYLPRQPLLVATLGGALLSPLARRRVRPLVASHLILAAIALFPVMGLTTSTARPLEQPIPVVSYNVFFGKLGRPELIEELAAIPADILLLQAANDSLGDRLRERLPDRTVRQDAELVLVTKLPVVHVEAYPDFPDGTAFFFVGYVLETPGGQLHVYNLHAFSPRHALSGEIDATKNIRQREAQVHAAVAIARAGGAPFILVGDTNLPPMSRIARAELAGLHDAQEESAFGFGYTFPAKRPWMRIDRVLGSDGIRFGSTRVAPLGRSDHRAVFVDLAIAAP